MKKIISLVVALTVGTTLFAAQNDSIATSNQWTDISLFHINRIDAKNATPLIWCNHENGNYFLESRINFDWSNTAGLFLGKTFSNSEKFWITPKIGILFGGRGSDGYNAFSPEFNFGGKIGSCEYFTMNQRTIAIDQHPDFIYQYTEVRWHANKHLALCYAIQFYKEMDTSNDWWIDHGPVLIVSLGKVYLKPWVTFDPNHTNKKIVLGIGYKL